MRLSKFKLKAISGPNCHTIQTEFHLKKELSLQKYLNIPLQLLTLVHKYLFHRSTLPEVCSEYFIAKANILNYNTKCKDDIHLNSGRLSYGHRCIKSEAASLWNASPVELKNDMSVKMFKKKLSYHLLSML
jgi:hypothetical protein